MKATESLADFVRRVRSEKNLSLTDVERESARHGERIAASYVSRIENYGHSPSPEKLKALARGLHVPEDEVFAIARGAVPKEGSEGTEADLLNYFRELPPDEQRYVLVTVKALHRERRRKRSRVA